MNTFATPVKLKDISNDINTRKSHKPKLQSVNHISPRDYDKSTTNGNITALSYLDAPIS